MDNHTRAEEIALRQISSGSRQDKRRQVRSFTAAEQNHRFNMSLARRTGGGCYCRFHEGDPQDTIEGHGTEVLVY
jgi:hypothetical protein